MRRFWLALLSALAASPAFAEEGSGADLVVALRLGARSVDTFARRNADGAISVPGDVLHALGIAAANSESSDVLLSDVAGLSYSLDPANAAIVLSCTAACYPNQEIGAAPAPLSRNASEPGAFFNADLSATATNEETNLAGAFELGAFGPAGAGGATWTIKSDGALVRLDTQWTLDDPARRTRMRIGDSVTRAGLGGAPVRFGGVQWATDFSLDPGFVFYPVPSLHGESAAPSTIDLYIDGALRSRHDVEGGPFTILDAPILTGAGVAELVVTDVLGREQRFAQTFYASPAMLRPGLSDYSIALGAVRHDYGVRSFSYGDALFSALGRRGLTQAITIGGRLDVESDLAVFTAGGSFAAYRLGQIDAALAESDDEASAGRLVSLSWSRQGQRLYWNANLQQASAGFRRPGDAANDQERRQISASVSTDLGSFGAASVSYVAQERSRDGDVETLSFNYQPIALPFGRMDISALRVAAEDEEPFSRLRCRTRSHCRTT